MLHAKLVLKTDIIPPFFNNVPHSLVIFYFIFYAFLSRLDYKHRMVFALINIHFKRCDALLKLLLWMKYFFVYRIVNRPIEGYIQRDNKDYFVHLKFFFLETVRQRSYLFEIPKAGRSAPSRTSNVKLACAQDVVQLTRKQKVPVFLCTYTRQQVTVVVSAVADDILLDVSELFFVKFVHMYLLRSVFEPLVRR